MSFQTYLSLQIKWARCLRRHLHLHSNEKAMEIWATEGYAEQFCAKFRNMIEE